jgi:hypothetical protein
MEITHPAVPLEASVESAGRALACMFSSSDEYEAALIAERRAEGRYQAGHGRRLVLIGGIGVAVLTLVLFFLV